MGKISGPLLDRIDLQVEVQPVNFEQISSKQPGEPSAAIRERVIKARAIQSLRYKNHPGVHCNAQMTTALLHKYAEPDAEGMEKLREAITKMNMSARAYDRILKVARTIADLEASVAVRQHKIAPYRNCRILDQKSRNINKIHGFCNCPHLSLIFKATFLRVDYVF
jgi:magnesium chelatase family protein